MAMRLLIEISLVYLLKIYEYNVSCQENQDNFCSKTSVHFP